MKKQRKVRRTQERHFSAHHMLIDAAVDGHARAAKKRKGSFYGQLSALLFSAVAIEALCNSIGERVIPDWDDFETARPNAKLRLLAKELDIAYDKAKEPWATARWLIKFRNSVAHAKPERIVEEVVMTLKDHERHQFDVPLSKLEKLVTAPNAARAVEGVKEIRKRLLEKLPREHKVLLNLDHWTSTAMVES